MNRNGWAAWVGIYNRFLGTERAGEGEHSGLWLPSIESYMKEGKLIIKAELPGVDAKDLDLTISFDCPAY